MTIGGINILEMHEKPDGWEPPVVDELEIARCAAKEMNISGRETCLYVFRTEPYIDTLLIHFDEAAYPEQIRRFTFRKGYYWDYDDEMFFHLNCIRSGSCSCPGGAIDRIFREYSEKYPEWNLKRYYTKGLLVLDHIYHCMQQNTVKEMLYKSGLDEFAVHIDDLDEINLLARRPSDLFDGLSIRVLRALNCSDGIALLCTSEGRAYIKELYAKFPDIFDSRLNNAHCCYLSMLIKGKLTPGETGRLFREKKTEYDEMWCRSIFSLKMESEKSLMDFNTFIQSFRDKIAVHDPIYDKYIDKLKPISDLNEAKEIVWYLTMKDEYNRRFRISNRKREYQWQERTPKYIIRYPQTVNDFIREAIYMQNCLLAYLEATVDNDTTILFMRRSKDVNAPFITIEIQGNELKQAYHRFNHDCSDEEAVWITAWCHRHEIHTGRFKFNHHVDDLG